MTCNGILDAYKYVVNDIHGVNSIYGAITNFVKIIPSIKKVIFNNPATIVFWTDGTKTVVKCTNEEFDPEKGLSMAISKKALGNQGNYYNTFKKWLPKEDADSDYPTITCKIPSMEEAFHNVLENLKALNNLHKRKTFREEVEEKEPNRISPYSWGGVTGCPRDKECCCEVFDEKKCTDCWNREIPEEMLDD